MCCVDSLESTKGVCGISSQVCAFNTVQMIPTCCVHWVIWGLFFQVWFTCEVSSPPAADGQEAIKEAGRGALLTVHAS